MNQLLKRADEMLKGHGFDYASAADMPLICFLDTNPVIFNTI